MPFISTSRFAGSLQGQGSCLILGQYYRPIFANAVAPEWCRRDVAEPPAEVLGCRAWRVRRSCGMNRLSGVSGAGEAVGEGKSASESRIDPGSEPRRFLAAAFGLLHVTAAVDLWRSPCSVPALSVAQSQPQRH